MMEFGMQNSFSIFPVCEKMMTMIYPLLMSTMTSLIFWQDDLHSEAACHRFPMWLNYQLCFRYWMARIPIDIQWTVIIFCIACNLWIVCIPITVLIWSSEVKTNEFKMGILILDTNMTAHYESMWSLIF